MSSARVESIRSTEGLARLRPEWEEIAGHSPAYPFTSHVWQETWWQAFGRPPRGLQMLALRSGGELMGILPLMETRGRLRGLPLRILGFAQDAAAPRADILWRGEDPGVLAAMLDHVGKRVQGWDCLVLRKIPVGSATLPALEAALRGCGYRHHVHPSLHTPYLSIAGDWESFLRSRPRNFRRNCRNKLNRVARSGRAIEVEEIRDWARFAAVYDEICGVCSRSWKAARGIALTSHPERVWFYRRLAEQAAQRGWLSVWTLRFDGKMVAYEYDLHVNGVGHALLASFDEEFRALSPGFVLDYHVVRQFFLDGRRGYDQGGGDAFYKRRWTESTLDHVDVIAFPERWRGALAHWLEYRVVSWLRAGRARLLGRSEEADRGRRFLAVRESVPWGSDDGTKMESHHDDRR